MLTTLIEHFRSRESDVQSWLESKRKLLGKEPLYASVDLRNAGYKIVPVDTNLFPAGWNNLCPNDREKASAAFRKYFDEFFPGTQCLLILPEDHTRNLYYFSNVRSLQQILKNAGFEVVVGSLHPDLGEKSRFLTQEGEELILHQVQREGNQLFANNRSVCQVLVNNDFSAGIPELLKGVRQNLLPTPEIGWHHRQKSRHFERYRELAEEFGEVMGMDPWHFTGRFSLVNEVNFDDPVSREKIAKAVEVMIQQISADYQKFGIQATPSVFLKNNAGTYGLGVIRVNNGEEVRTLNQKNRKQMRVGKGSVSIGSILLQEGIPTLDRVNGHVAEPVIYLAGNRPVGGFYRMNEEKGDLDNLNSKGMHFSHSCLHDEIHFQDLAWSPDLAAGLSRLYHVLGTIASLAAGLEINDLPPSSGTSFPIDLPL